MTRYKLKSKDGTPFAGSQIQANGPSVQGELARAIEALSGVHVVPRGAGRTDAGVHARGQVAHSTSNGRTRRKRCAIVNHHLRPPPSRSSPARSWTKASTRVFPEGPALSLSHRQPARAAGAGSRPGVAGRGAAQRGGDERSGPASHRPPRFTTFRSSQCQGKSPLRTLDRLEVARDGDDIFIAASARSFLHHQVRSMAGSLKMVGEGKWQPEDMRRALEARSRRLAAP